MASAAGDKYLKLASDSLTRIEKMMSMALTGKDSSQSQDGGEESASSNGQDGIVRTISSVVNSIKSYDKKAQKSGKALTRNLKDIVEVVTSKGIPTALDQFATSYERAMEKVIAIHQKMSGDGNTMESMALVGSLGTSILKFAALTALATPLLVIASPGLLIFTGTIALIAMVAGKFFRNDNTNVLQSFAKSIQSLAISIALFALSIVATSVLFDKMGPNIWRTIGYVAAFAVTFSVIGLAHGLIKKGAVALAFTSLSVLALGLTSKVLMDSVMLNQGLFPAMNIPIFLAALGATFALAGAGPIPMFIVLGSIAMSAAAIPLLIIGKALKTFADAPIIDEKKAESIKLGMRTMVEGVAGAFSGLSIKQILTLPLKLPMLGLIGMSVASLGSGLSEFQKTSGIWKPEDNYNLQATITTLADVFGNVAQNYGSENVQEGIEATMRMGKNIKRLYNGVMAWKDTTITPEEAQKISDNISIVLNTIPASFAAIGMRERETREGEFTMFGLKFSNPFSKGDVELGIKATRKLGNVLKSLYDGISAWRPGGEMVLSRDEITAIGENIYYILTRLPDAFGRIGQMEKETDGFFSKGYVGTGIKTTKGMIPIIKSVADFITSTKDLDVTGTTTALGDGIAYVIQKVVASGEVKDTVKDVFKITRDIIDQHDPFEKMLDTLKLVNDELIRQRDTMNSMSMDSLMAYSLWTESVSRMAGLNPKVLRKNLEYSMEVANGAYGFGRKVLDLPDGTSNETTARETVDSLQENNPMKALTEELRVIFARLTSTLNSQNGMLAGIRDEMEEVSNTLSGTLRVSNSGDDF